MEFADLHIHTTASDGLLSPREVVRWAKVKHIKAVGITDHDTVHGIEEAVYAGNIYNIEVVPGIELNTQYKDEEIHILGYYIDYRSTELLNRLNTIRNSRFDRMFKIVDKLNAVNIKISIDDVKKIAADASIGRPHIARAMVDKGYIPNIKSAFDKYIGKNKIAYVERYRLSVAESVELINSVGGVTVLAHPGLIENRSYLGKILDCGIEGIEVYHTKHDNTITKEMLAIAKSRNLLITGGSDCHGMFVNNEPILGNVNINYNVVNEIKNISKEKCNLKWRV